MLDHLDRPRAVISIWGPHIRVTANRFAELGALTVTTAAALGPRGRSRTQSAG